MSGKVGIVILKSSVALLGNVVAGAITVVKKKNEIMAEISDLQTEEIVDLIITDAREALTKVMDAIKS